MNLSGLANSPVILALLAASLFGAWSVLARRSLRHVDAQTGSMLTIVTAAAAFWALAPFLMEGANWRSPGVWVFVVNGVFHPTLSMWLSFEANRRMGPTVSATLSATTPLFATAGAVLALGERLSAPILAGTAATVAGVIVLSWLRGGKADWAAPALVFPLGAAIVRSLNHVWAKFGLSLLPSPYFAAVVSFSVSATISVLAYRAKRGVFPLRIPVRGVLWCALSGLSVTGAILSMYTALNSGLVVVVSPIINTNPLFTLAWALLFRQEYPNRRILLGVALVVGGVVLIGMREG